MTLLDEDGDAVYGGDDRPLPAGDSVGSSESASGGTFRLEIEADDDAKYAVVVCDEAGPRGWNRSSPVQQSDSREQMPSAPDEPVPDVVG